MLLLLVACTDKSEDSGETVAAPTVEWLAPLDGETVTAGPVACSTIIEGFTLQDPAKHNDGAPIGHLIVAVDDVETVTTGDTTFTVDLTAGAHTLTALLRYADGDDVLVGGGALCDEGDSSCAPASASISVTAQ